MEEVKKHSSHNAIFLQRGPVFPYEAKGTFKIMVYPLSARVAAKTDYMSRAGPVSRAALVRAGPVVM